MQWILNMLYKVFGNFFGLVGKVVAPNWLSNLTLGVVKYCVIANYYFPLDTLLSVAVSVLAVTGVLMIISALLQIF